MRLARLPANRCKKLATLANNWHPSRFCKHRVFAVIIKRNDKKYMTIILIIMPKLSFFAILQPLLLQSILCIIIIDCIVCILYSLYCTYIKSILSTVQTLLCCTQYSTVYYVQCSLLCTVKSYHVQYIDCIVQNMLYSTIYTV